MSRPTKATPGGCAYLDLQNRARRERRSNQELQTLYVLERWLARLAASRHASEFVLKGGMLLAVFDARRATADADLLARNLANDEETVIARVVDVASVELDQEDGVEFLVDTVAARSIREDDLYTGVRISMACRISTASVKLRLDINFGDPVTPAPQLLDLPSQRPGVAPVPVLGYPIETVLAEKTSTAIALRAANTRVRDYADLYMLTGKQAVSYESARSALEATTRHRGVDILPLSAVIGDLAESRQQTYSAFKKRLGPDGAHLPDSFGDVVAAVIEFVDPLAAGDLCEAWDPETRKWV
ncbi:nucleotidyl transferase AbiEii/AbiGii toxin family protein [Lentzea albidocapillata]|uniref:Nucleotidyl transferase AbiEii toxin, Type IV TA system n=1 Tax=Lentzea albidocapillata TaxID=40571 RepID=A0A1W2FKL3_9PSEU|nr:nucleotidyl transferase AbiEii/AbiGii toxin family protein [Lentzea albidocapillata]SMD22212.1 Nucleotidyl transferase AbiEii toxin, Type IV TA system [Lentzea albidocapillata]